MALGSIHLCVGKQKCMQSTQQFAKTVVCKGVHIWNLFFLKKNPFILKVHIKRACTFNTIIIPMYNLYIGIIIFKHTYTEVYIGETYNKTE